MPLRRSGRLAAGALLLLLLGAPSSAAAESVTEPAFLDWYNRRIHAFNTWAIERFGTPSSWSIDGLVPPAISEAVGNVLGNLVNEPVTTIAGLVAGDTARAENAVQRFAVNSTVGIAGIADVAAKQGNPRDHLDLGLALCVRGLPEGPVIVLPLVGPRTLRDGVADGLLISVMFFYVPFLVLGDVTALVTWSALGLTDAVAKTVSFRQMDLETVTLQGGYEDVRTAYLIQRHARCEGYRSIMADQQRW